MRTLYNLPPHCVAIRTYSPMEMIERERERENCERNGKTSSASRAYIQVYAAAENLLHQELGELLRSPQDKP